MQRLETKIPVMIDANVFFDLHDQSDPESEESQALLADWLRADIELCMTDELWNEINRNKDLEDRNRQRALAHSFTQRRSDMTRFEATCGELRPFFTTPMSERDESDLREVARTIAADVQFFVTRDAALLDKGDTLYQQFGLTILRPTDLIVHLDALRRETEYQPARLAGTVLELRLVQRGQQEVLTEHFQCTEQGEKKADFQRRFRRLLSDPQRFECYVVQDDHSGPLAVCRREALS